MEMNISQQKRKRGGEEKVEVEAGLCFDGLVFLSLEKEGLEPQHSMRSSDLGWGECSTSAFYRFGMKNVFN